jgi:hypothetical protein
MLLVFISSCNIHARKSHAAVIDQFMNAMSFQIPRVVLGAIWKESFLV